MPHIALRDGAPGIRALFEFRPETARPLLELVEVLLRGPSSLSRGDRELIAAYVSQLNECVFCAGSHGAFAAAQLEGGAGVVEAVKRSFRDAPISSKMKSLLAIAAKVQKGGRHVSEADVVVARAEGATDVEIHDTVLIAAAFCMFNRYVDGLATVAPEDPAAYAAMAERIVNGGYLAPR
ncbi:MAG: carboxymuconolactone decarboxylase family protein [Polyangiaceae bacterium]